MLLSNHTCLWVDVITDWWQRARYLCIRRTKLDCVTTTVVDGRRRIRVLGPTSSMCEQLNGGILDYNLKERMDGLLYFGGCVVEGGDVAGERGYVLARVCVCEKVCVSCIL